MSRRLTTVSFVLLVLLGPLKADDLVKTTSGPIRGTTTKSFTQKQVAVYYGIPYAQPPFGDLRFAAPVEVKPWQVELNATTPSLACYQKISTDYEDTQIENMEIRPKKPWSEDCLKLHIWVPLPRRKNITVMVYIHGGGYFEGDPLLPMTSGATLAAEEHVIVVSMNYRLHVQGFLYLGTTDAPGNMGLMDQQMALTWIRRNIASFGGNPDDVTIFGMSAGGSSVGFHILSPGSRDLFKRGILMSGTPIPVWSTDPKEKALEKSMKLAKFLGCNFEDMGKVLKCMQSIDSERFADWKPIESSIGDLWFIPMVDGKFISDFPVNLLSKKEVKNADVMIGGTVDESGFFLSRFIPEILQSADGRITEKQFQSGVDRAYMMYGNLTRKVLSSYYTDWTRPEDPLMLRDAFKDLYSEIYFHCAYEEFADIFSSLGNKVYRYVVDHPFEKLPLPQWMGTPHGFDTSLHLGASTGEMSIWTMEDKILSRRVMRWFANFARTGNPSGPGESGPMWLEYTVKNKYFMRISANSKVEKHFRTQRCTMMKKLVDVIAQNLQQCHH